MRKIQGFLAIIFSGLKNNFINATKLFVNPINIKSFSLIGLKLSESITDGILRRRRVTKVIF